MREVALTFEQLLDVVEDNFADEECQMAIVDSFHTENISVYKDKGLLEIEGEEFYRIDTKNFSRAMVSKPNGGAIYIEIKKQDKWGKVELFTIAISFLRIYPIQISTES